MTSHFQHRILFPSTSTTWLALYGIVVLLGKALESLVQKNQRVLSLRLAHRLLRFAVFSRDRSSAT
jgi:hypothetical protein